jgi:acyl-coenzyme A thioesterase PaaI-like protein
LKDAVTNHIGTMHAGALFTLGEAASGLCAMRALGAVFVEARAVTRSASIEFRRPAVGRIRALGEPLQPVRETLERLDREGRASFEVVVRLLDRNDVEVAELRIGWSLRRPLST